jgi:hypothetical protein
MMKRTRAKYLLLFMCLFILGLSSCNSNKKYINASAKDFLIDESLILKKSKKFKYQKKWDLGHIDVRGTWYEVKDTLIFKTELDKSTLYEITYEKNSTQNLNVFSIQKNNIPLPYVSIKVFLADGKDFNLETDDKGFFETQNRVDIIKLYNNPLLYSRDFCIKLNKQLGKKITINFFENEQDFFLEEEKFIKKDEFIYPTGEGFCPYFNAPFILSSE